MGGVHSTDVQVLSHLTASQSHPNPILAIPTLSRIGRAVNHPHIKAAAAQRSQPRQPRREDSAPADVLQQLFSITESSRIYQKSQGKEGKESWPVEGRSKELAHPLKLQSSASITSCLHFSSRIALNHLTFPSSPCCGGDHLLPSKSWSSLGKPLLAGLHGHRGELRFLFQALGAGEIPPGK